MSFIWYVSIHAPAWGATVVIMGGAYRSYRFNPRTRVGCDNGLHSYFRSCAGFNPRTRVGCDPLFSLNSIYTDSVSIHAPAWGATCPKSPYHARGLCFNPRTRVGGDLCFTPIAPNRLVSIHAPAWGATPVRVAANRVAACFNPRTRVGCDLKTTRKRPLEPCFNPRTRVGCDMGKEVEFSKDALFQSTHPRGVRRLDLYHATGRDTFQSTHPRGVRHPRTASCSRRSLFQSTHPRGVRPAQQTRVSKHVWVSIHAPAWGATPADGRTRAAKRRFNPRTRVGCD